MESSLHYTRTAERVTPIITMCLVFLCGAGAGAVVMSKLEHGTIHAAARPRPNLKNLPSSIGEWQRQLNLSDSQVVQLTSILDDFSRYYDNVMSFGYSRITQILNENQKRKFEQMLSESKAK